MCCAAPQLLRALPNIQVKVTLSSPATPLASRRRRSSVAGRKPLPPQRKSADDAQFAKIGMRMRPMGLDDGSVFTNDLTNERSVAAGQEVVLGADTPEARVRHRYLTASPKSPRLANPNPTLPYPTPTPTYPSPKLESDPEPAHES